MTHRIHLTIDFNPRIVLILFVMVLVSAVAVELGSETLTMTTTYPSPAGIYARLVTTGGSSGSPVNTDLARQAGKVTIGLNQGGSTSVLSVTGNSTFTGSITLGTALTAANGGTGLISPGANGNVLTSNGNGTWSSTAPSGGSGLPSPGPSGNVLTSDGIRWYSGSPAGNGISCYHQTGSTTGANSSVMTDCPSGKIGISVNCYGGHVTGFSGIGDSGGACWFNSNAGHNTYYIDVLCCTGLIP